MKNKTKTTKFTWVYKSI